MFLYVLQFLSCYTGKPLDDVLTEDLKFALREIGSEVMAEGSMIDVSSSAN